MVKAQFIGSLSIVSLGGRWWAKKGEINAAETLEALKAIDLNAGWPEA